MVSLFGGLVLVIVVPVVALLAMIAFFAMASRRRPANSPPLANIGIPLIGNYIEFAKNPIAFITTCLNKYGGIYTVPMLHKNLTFLLGPEVSAPFFQLSDEYMSQAEVYGFMTPVFGRGVVYDAEPKKRMQQMQTMAGALRSNNLKSYVAKIEMEAHDYVKQWGDSGEVDLRNALSEMIILTSSRCLHGDDVRENMFVEISRIYHDLDKGVEPLSFFFPYAPTPAHSLRDNARKEMVEIFSKVIRARKAKGGDTSEATDILQVFIDMIYKDDGSTLTEDQIVGLLIAMLFAGQHTSSITATWTIMFLLHNPDCMETFFAEQEALLGGKDCSKTPLTFESVGNMEYLQNCVKESLRMFPPLIMLMRMAMSDIETTITVDGVKKTIVIPKGDIVVTSPAAASRMPEVFSNPDKFDPDRFSPARNEQKTPYAYLGFGGGRHACLGQQFGLLQTKTITSVLMRTFKFELIDSEFPEPDYTAMVVGPKNHCKVKYTRIK